MCKKVIFLISSALVLGLVGSTFAAELHVYGYMPTAKYKTIQAAYDAANTGDIITIHKGKYTLGWANDDSKHDITFRAYMSNYNDPTTRDNVRIMGQTVIAYNTGGTFDGLSWAANTGY